MTTLFAWMYKHERHLSAGAVLAGFIFDSIFFDRIDEPITHQVFISYLCIAAIAILWRHYLEEHTVEGVARPRWHSLFPIMTQFAFGGLWSGFLIFYSQSATLATSWPFLLLLAGIFLGNELFKKYHERLVFNAVLYFFALYSYTIFSVPLVTRAIGIGTFIISGIAAVAAFALFMLLLRRLGHFRFLKSAWQIRLWAGGVVVALNLFYFANILPPLPLALAEGGIYHMVEKQGAEYIAQAEAKPWYASLGFAPALHVAPGDSLFAYSAVFAPIALTTTITHEWQRYNSAAASWVTQHTISFSISGGRESGYRGYTITPNPPEGSWRVSIRTSDGRLIGRLNFSVVRGAHATTETVQL